MIAALVPAKALARAKGRLSAALSEEERRTLSLAMLGDVLAALASVPEIEVRAVVSPDTDVLQAASVQGALAIAEPPETRDLNGALTYAAAQLMGQGAGTLLVVPMDVPSITERELRDLLEALPKPTGVAIVRSAGRGTSALAVSPPDVIPFSFGPRSASAHQQQAVRARVPSRLLRLPSIAIDIDSPQDLVDLLSRPDQTETQRLLWDLGIAERLRAPLRRA